MFKFDDVTFREIEVLYFESKETENVVILQGGINEQQNIFILKSSEIIDSFECFDDFFEYYLIVKINLPSKLKEGFYKGEGYNKKYLYNLFEKKHLDTQDEYEDLKKRGYIK